MPKINIYVSKDLKRRMDEAEGINWSPVAQLAFEAEISDTASEGEDEHRATTDIDMPVMSLRDWFAGMVAQGIAANSKPGTWPLGLPTCSYRMADDLIAERERSNPDEPE